MTYKIFSAKKASVWLMVTVLGLVLFCTAAYKISSTSKKEKLPQNAMRDSDRVLYLTNLGIKVKSEKSEKKQITVPEVFSDIYEEYNDLQKSAGFDLKKYSGKTVTVFTYKIDSNKRDDLFAHIMVYKDSVIGGDIAAISADDGFMLPLKSVTEELSALTVNE